MHSESTAEIEQMSAEDNIERLKQLDTYQYEYAKQALYAQAQDQREVREHMQANTKAGLKFCTMLFGVIVVVILSAFALDKEQFVLEALKYVFVGAGGGGLGYVAGFKKGQHK